MERRVAGVRAMVRNGFKLLGDAKIVCFGGQGQRRWGRDKNGGGSCPAGRHARCQPPDCDDSRMTATLHSTATPRMLKCTSSALAWSANDVLYAPYCRQLLQC